MASGSFNLTNSSKNSGGSYLAGKVEWSATTNKEKNYSAVTVSVYAKKANSSVDITVGTGGSWGYSISIGGNTKTSAVSKNIVASFVKVASYTYNVPHNANGTKSITIKCSVTGPSDSNFAGLTTSGSKTVALDDIKRISTVSATNANIGSKSTITIKRVSSELTHKLTYEFVDESGTISSKTSETSISWTVPTSFYSEIPKAKTGKCTITCATYDGSTEIGLSTCTITVTASESACAPAVSVSAVDVNDNTIALTGSNKKIVKGLSNVTVTTTVTAKNSASISSVSVSCGSMSVTGTSVTFTGAESATIKATAKDSRGYSTTESASGLSLVKYVIPTINVAAVRESPTSNVVMVTATGNWFNGSFGATQNTLTVKVRYRLKTESSYGSYTTMTLTKNGNTYSATATLTGLDYQSAYYVQVRAFDAYYGEYESSKYKTVTLNKGIPVFDWGENDFQFNVPVHMPQSIYQSSGDGGLNMHNSDIVGFNAIYGSDEAAGPKEGINFYRDGTNWDGVWAQGGNLFFCPNYPANTTQYSVFYVAGDEITFGSQWAVFYSFITDSTKRLTITIPLTKQILASNISFSGYLLARGISGYLVGNTAEAGKIDMSGGTGYTVSYSRSICGLSIRIQFDEAILNGTNNTPVAVTPYSSFKITFS